ncbi:Ribokinase [Aphelenchoides besseyi]|nr:Ribokinase [Aphelenchoides besseyi]KAI6199288.1 Ribokinase [Aphelenchoides besseyi]
MLSFPTNQPSKQTIENPIAQFGGALSDGNFFFPALKNEQNDHRLCYVERFPRPGESVRGKKFELGNGGKGANQAVASAKLGATVKMIGMVGDDMFGEHNLENLRKAGVNTELVVKQKYSPTGCAAITVDENGENNIVINPGANAYLTPERARELESEIAKAEMIICQAEVPEDANLEALRLARKHGVKTVFNPAPGYDMNRKILEFTDIICTNETETECIVQSKLNSVDEFKDAAKKMLDYGPRMAIITLGEKGVLVAERSNGDVKVDHVESEKGAGDCFCGSLVHLLVNCPELKTLEAVRKASQIAALSVQKCGCQSSYPTIEEAKKKGIL